MTENIVRNKHTGEPGNPGGFGSKKNDEAETTLVEAVSTPWADRMTQIDSLRWEVTKQLQRAAEGTIVETAGKYPDAVTAAFTWVDDFDGSALQFTALRDVDGEDIEVDMDDENTFSDAARTFEDDFDTVRKASAFDVDFDDTDKVTLDLKTYEAPGHAPSAYSADRATEAATQLSDFADKQLAAAGALGVKAIAREAFPNAASVVIGDHNDGPGAPFFAVFEVKDADGEILWDFSDCDDTLADAFAEYAVVLDRDMSLIVEDGPETWTHTF